MQYKPLGNTSLQVSVIGFGGAPIGLQDYLGHENRESPEFAAEAIAAIREAVSRGINFFDTAPEYGEGRCERLLGEALEAVRKKVFLAGRYPADPRLGPSQLTRILRSSLDRLRTDHLDVLQMHGTIYTDDQVKAIADSGMLDWADEMQSRGLCRFTGITAEVPSGALERLLRAWRFDVLQIAYNVIYQSACDRQREPAGVIPLAKSMGMGVVAMRAATSDFLPRLLRSEFPEIDAGRVIRMAINFVLSTPEVDCALVGMKTVNEVIANIALADDLSLRIDVKALHDRYA